MHVFNAVKIIDIWTFYWKLLSLLALFENREVDNSFDIVQMVVKYLGINDNLFLIATIVEQIIVYNDMLEFL